MGRKRSGGLPIAPSSFVGRERELEELDALADRWLVTLVGPAGVGKTRLALAAASRRVVRARAFVDLSDARDEGEVIAAALVARGLDVPERADVGMQRLANVLGRERTLTVLDNAEHVVDAVANLVVRCRARDAHFIVTSRQPLSVAGEERYEVPPLSEDAAALLFEERAAPNVWLTDVERKAVREVVSQLERLPLAIELAAARTSVLLPSEIAQRLSHSLAILKGGPRDAPRRHASLDAAIEWSFRLLEPHEQRALVECAVFHDGFTAAAAAAVLDVGADIPTLDVLQSLRDKSLLRTELDPRANHETRFRLYESVRSFAANRLDPSDGVFARHVAYYATQASVVEVANVLAAVRSAEKNDPEICARIAVTIAPILATHYPLEPRLLLLERGVRAAERTEDVPLLCRALTARGYALLLSGRVAEAGADAERAAMLARSIDALDEEGAAELLLARIAVDRMRLEEARAHATRSTVCSTGAARGRAFHTLGWIETQLADTTGAQQSLAVALAASVEHRDRTTEGSVLTALAELAQSSGRVEEAVQLHERARTIAREAGNRSLEALAALNLAYALAELAAFDRVAKHSQETLAIARELGDHRLEVLALASLAFARQAQGRLDEALEATTLALSFPAGELATIVARVCHGAILAERGSLTLATAIFDALAAAAAQAPDHPLGRVVHLARLFCDLGAGIERARQGDAAGAAAHVFGIRDALARSIASRPLEHPDVRVWRRFWIHTLDRYTVFFGSAVCRLEIDEAGRWFRRDGGATIACGKRPVLRRLLVALGRAHAETPGRAVPVSELIASSWPGEKMLADSARRRLQVAISRLRELGLAGVIVNDADGYLLAPAARVVLVSGM